MSDFNQPIPDITPHYTDMRFATAQTVWIAKNVKFNKGGYVNHANYEYSDRLWQWNWNKADEAHKTIDSSIDRRSAKFIQEFLRFYYDDPTIKLVHVMAGFNLATGYPYNVYGFTKG